MPWLLSYWVIFPGLILEIVRRLVSVPAELKHLPRVSLFSLLWSYATGEVEEQRIRRLFLPFSNSQGEGIVLVWALGRWMVHILDYKVARSVMENRGFVKNLLADPHHSLFLRFIGPSNIFFAEGAQWERHSRIVHTVLHRNVPVEKFASLSRTLFDLMGTGGRVCWDDLAHRFTLDAVGTTVLGHDFQALQNPSSPFVEDYHKVMSALANPLYIAIPALERYCPRRDVAKQIDALTHRFLRLLEEKRRVGGPDILTYMLEEPGLTDMECRDNSIVFFMAGHDTTAGAISTLIYFLGLHPEVQERARREVLSILGSTEPTVETLSRLPFLLACIRESMRLNNPSTVTIPRVSSDTALIGDYTIPANTPVLLNMYAILHNESIWPNHASFDPERFLRSDVDMQKWLPFGLGARRCPARNFALYEQRTLAAMLLREYEWEIPTDSVHLGGIKNAFSAFALNLPRDMYIQFKRRRDVFER